MPLRILSVTLAVLASLTSASPTNSAAKALADPYGFDPQKIPFNLYAFKDGDYVQSFLLNPVILKPSKLPNATYGLEAFSTSGSGSSPPPPHNFTAVMAAYSYQIALQLTKKGVTYTSAPQGGTGPVTFGAGYDNSTDSGLYLYAQYKPGARDYTYNAFIQGDYQVCKASSNGPTLLFNGNSHPTLTGCFNATLQLFPFTSGLVP